MKFGKVDNPAEIDFQFPSTHKQTRNTLKRLKKSHFKDVRIGCAKWNKKDLKNFYPKKVKDELGYYATQFNSIELNASFYRMFPKSQFVSWKKKTDNDFKFFPKVPRVISHLKRLKESEKYVDDFSVNVISLGRKLGMVFLQMRDDFQPKNFGRLEPFFIHWPKEIPLAIELRHPDWFSNEQTSNELCELLKKYKITNVITDSAFRRDLLHMRLTSNSAFIRFNGTNHSSDFTRLDDWIDRIEEWYKLGLKNIYFFLHQNVELASPLLAAYFIEKFNERFKTQLKIPTTVKDKTKMD